MERGGGVCQGAFGWKCSALEENPNSLLFSGLLQVSAIDVFVPHGL